MGTSSQPEGRVLFSRLTKHVRLRQLQLLLALQQCSSIVKAAAHLDMSQSAATQALAELERVLDMRLFERHSRGIRPTQAGMALIDTVRGVMSELEDVSETLASIRIGASAALRLGAIPAAAHSILAPLLLSFYALKSQQVHIDVQEGEGARLLPMLVSGGLDAVFCRRPTLLPDTFVFDPLLSDEAVFVAASNHPLATVSHLPLVSLSDAHWILPTTNIAVRDIFEREVLPQLPQARWFPLSTVSLPVLQGLLSVPKAVSLVPRSVLPALGHGRSSSGISILDMQVNQDAFKLADLGVARSGGAAPVLLLEMLELWRTSIGAS